MLLSRRLAALAVAAAAWLAPPPAHACTTFCWESAGTLLFGKNYDWDVADGLLVVNQHGVAKEAFTDDRPAHWTSRFGSVTFNQYGREFPCGGMNERGLVVELMWLDETEYPPPDARPALPTLQWIQYQLDTSATVADVVASDRAVRITAGGSARIHFLVADASGATAAVEFIAGRLVAHRGADLPFRVLTNDTYARSADYAHTIDPDRATFTRSSLDRFACAAQRVKARPARLGAAGVKHAFDLLREVAQGERTQWSIVYAIGARRVYFRTRKHRAIRSLDLDDLEFDCGKPVRIVSLDTGHAGDISGRLALYTYEANLELVRAAFTQTEFLRGVPPAGHEQHARYPDRARCARR